nr:hypothetical protein [Tanacetum cinerariifolium]
MQRIGKGFSGVDTPLFDGGCIQTKGKIAELDADEDVTLKEVDAKVAMDADVHGRAYWGREVIKVVTVAKLMIKVVTTAATTITDVQVPKAGTPRRRRGVIIKDPKKAATTLVFTHSEVQSKDKGKGILVEEPKPLKRQAQIEHDKAFARELEVDLNANINWNDTVDQVKRKEKQDNTVIRYQALKRNLVTKAYARKNMMVYLKNMVGFMMDFFKGMTYTDIRPIFEKHYNLNQAFLERIKEKVTGHKEEGSKRKSESSEQRAAKKQRINEETEDLKIHLQIVANDDDNVYTEATLLALKSFDREALEMLWKLVQERFQSLEPNNFSDDFLLNTLQVMFENPNVEASIWRDQKGRYGLAKVKRWKIFESYGVHILILTTTQMILLVEKKYPLTRFTLEQMLNSVRQEVEEESEVSLELLRLQENMIRDYCYWLKNLILLIQVKAVRKCCWSKLLLLEENNAAVEKMKKLL